MKNLFPQIQIDTIKKLDLKHPSTWLCTWFGLGFLPKAPGTFGSVGALPFGLILVALGGVPLLLAGILLITLAAYWAIKKFQSRTGDHDNQMIVIDEVIGQWIALIPAALNPAYVGLSFVLFRAFDIIKPWPISFFDKNVKGPAGVLMDDIMAGLAAGIFLYIIQLQYDGFS